METLIVVAGCAQLFVVAGSLLLPKVLGWRTELACLRPLTRQVFWVYSTYICSANVLFGVLSIARPGLLLDGTPLATMVAGFIAAWWGARLVIQFALYDRSARPPGFRFVLAEWALVLSFLANTAVYGTAAWRNLA